ncbi:MAG: hypothetical protein ACYC8T_29405 [Myxococcaceae bacterium]
MTWYTAYLGCFVLGVSFMALSLLVGKFGGDADGGGDGSGQDLGGHDMVGGGDVGDVSGDVSGGDSTHGSQGHAGLPLFSPSVLSVFVGMFGAGGLLLHKVLGISEPLFHAGGAGGISAVSGLSAAWIMMKLLIHAETNAMASHREVVGQEVEVVALIRGANLGQVAYTSGGAYLTLIACAEGDAVFAQGEKVQVLKVIDGVAHVGPVGSRPAGAVAAITSEAIGVPVDKERVK